MENLINLLHQEGIKFTAHIQTIQDEYQDESGKALGRHIRVRPIKIDLLITEFAKLSQVMQQEPGVAEYLVGTGKFDITGRLSPDPDSPETVRISYRLRKE